MAKRRSRVRSNRKDRTLAAGYRGVYINLDRAADRRKRMDEQLEALGLDEAYVRLPAVDGRTLGVEYAGAIGCYRSHAAAVRLACGSDVPVNIVEDDTRLSPLLPPFVRYAGESGLLERYDIVFTELWVDPGLDAVTACEEVLRSWLRSARNGPNDYRVVDARDHRIGAMSSYIVGASGAQRLSDILEEHIESPPGAVDAFIDHCVHAGRLRAAVVIPFLTVADAEFAALSDIQDIGADLNRFMLRLREAFFVESADGARSRRWAEAELAVAYRRLGEAPARLAFLRRFRDLLEERQTGGD